MYGGGWIKCHEIGTVAGGIVFKQKGKRKGGVNQYAAAICAEKAKELCGIYSRDDGSGRERGVQLGSFRLRQQKKRKLFTTFYNSLWSRKGDFFLSATLVRFGRRSN